MLVKNFMEEMVEEELENVLQDITMCKCDKCLADLSAIALNNLPPKYYSTHLGGIYNKTNKLKTQFRVEVIQEIIKASKIVIENTNHEVE